MTRSQLGGPARSRRRPAPRSPARAALRGRAPRRPVTHAVARHAARSPRPASPRSTPRGGEQAPGVLAVLTHLNAPRLSPCPPGGARSRRTRRCSPCRMTSIVYAGQPIAVVVADTLEQAQHAAAARASRYHAEPTPGWRTPTPTCEASVAETTTGPATHERGRRRRRACRRARRESTTRPTARRTSTTTRSSRTSTVAAVGRRQRLTLHDSTQGIFATPADHQALRVPPENVHVTSPLPRRRLWQQRLAVAARRARRDGRAGGRAAGEARRHAGADVLANGHRPETSSGCARRDAARPARRGPATTGSAVVPLRRARQPARPTRMLYACPNVRSTSHAGRLNVCRRPTFMRAPGETAGDVRARVGDGRARRRRGHGPAGAAPAQPCRRDPQDGKPWSSKSLRECYAQARERFGWAAPPIRARGRCATATG